jgi:hypothetical protein
VLRGGFRDGFAGWMIARLSALAVFLKYTQAYQYRHSTPPHAHP